MMLSMYLVFLVLGSIMFAIFITIAANKRE
jgi:hypothetical protein